jgi:hypothetical protein
LALGSAAPLAHLVFVSGIGTGRAQAALLIREPEAPFVAEGPDLGYRALVSVIAGPTPLLLLILAKKVRTTDTKVLIGAATGFGAWSLRSCF